MIAPAQEGHHPWVLSLQAVYKKNPTALYTSSSSCPRRRRLPKRYVSSPSLETSYAATCPLLIGMGTGHRLLPAVNSLQS